MKPLISVIIPTYNEEQNIATTCQKIIDYAKQQSIEIIVVDSPITTDNTFEIAQKLGIKTIKSPLKGRASQMNFGAKYANADTLYFVHADVSVHPTFISDILDSLSSGYDFGCYRYVFDSSSWLLKINAFFTRFPFIWCRGGDQTLFIRKNDFFLLGGFSEDHQIMEDYDFILRAKKKLKFRIIPKNITVSARKYKTNSYLRVQLANFIVMRMFLRKRASQEEMVKIYKSLLK